MCMAAAKGSCVNYGQIEVRPTRDRRCRRRNFVAKSFLCRRVSALSTRQEIK